MIVRIGIIRKKEGMPTSEFHNYWYEKHGPLVSKTPEIINYTQNQVVDSSQLGINFARGNIAVDGFSQLWFEDKEKMEKGFSEMTNWWAAWGHDLGRGAREGKLCLQRCSTCSHVEFYPKKYCSQCLNDSLEWFEASGLGTIHTFTVIHRAPSKQFIEKVPYVVALIDVDEGARLMANVLSPIEKVKVGSQVEVVFEETEDKVLPQFKLLEKGLDNNE